MSKRKKRLFIITLEIKNECWDYKIGQIIRSAVISNNINNAIKHLKIGIVVVNILFMKSQE